MKNKKLTWFIIPLLLLLMMLTSAGLAYAQEVGVGINMGKISVDEPMMPGGSYKLPAVSIINTGQVASDYAMGVSYHQDQKELQPPAGWFEFDPKTVTLEPGKSQSVNITLHISVKAKPGDYFAYLEAHPVAKEGNVAIGIAAAAKLYFTVKPANIFSAFANVVGDFFGTRSPYSWVGLGIIVLIIVVFLFRRFVHISLRVERKE
jgi:hypothetical protein